MPLFSSLLTQFLSSQAECVMLASNLFTEQDIRQKEMDVLQALRWELRPVTPYEAMCHLVMYANIGELLQDSLLHQAQVCIDFSLCGKMR